MKHKTKDSVLTSLAQRGIMATAWKDRARLTRQGWVVSGRAVIMPTRDLISPYPCKIFFWKTNIGWVPPCIKRHLGWYPQASDIKVRRARQKGDNSFGIFEKEVPDWEEILTHEIRFYCVQI